MLSSATHILEELIMHRLLAAAAVFALISPAAFAGTDFSIRCTACQSAFHDLVEDTSATLSYKALGPAEATGVTGIGVATFATYAPVRHEASWKIVTQSNVSDIGMVGVTVRKGLPLKLDVGAFYSAVPNTSVKVYGGELRYALLPGGVAVPALAIRGTYTTTKGLGDFDYNSYGGDVSISKGFALLTPYFGAGYERAKADPNGFAGLRTETISRGRFFAGLRIGLALLDITPEYESIGGNSVYNLLVGLSF
jgi:hypothetical protein